MTSEKGAYKISIGSADEYEDLVAEIMFPDIGGLIVSQENGPGQFEVSFHSFNEKSAGNFDYCRNVESEKIQLNDLIKALKCATNELKRLSKT